MANPTLFWPEKPQDIEIHPGHYVIADRIASGEQEGGDPWRNVLFWGDNKFVLGSLLMEDWRARLNSAGGIKMVYCDPPFGVGTNYNFQHAGVKKIAYRDVWEKSGNDYLSMLYERFWLIHKLLAEDGNFFLHLNWHNHHYAKILLDEIFGRENFHNEIIYCFSGGGIPRKALPRKHDVILWYSKSKNYTYNPEYHPFTPGTVERGRTKVKGKYARLREEGTPLPDWWTDVKKIASPTDREKLYFDTQKSEELIERIIRIGSNEGDLIADFFAGSGTTLACALKLGRKWIGCDQEYYAVHLTRKRLLDIQQNYNFKGSFDMQYSTDTDRQNNMNMDSNFENRPEISWEIVPDRDRLRVRLIDYRYKDYESEGEISFSIKNNQLKFAQSEKGSRDISVIVDAWDKWVDYWAVDDNYSKDRGFFPKIFSYRTQKNPELNTELVVPKNEQSNQVFAIKVIDVFGRESINQAEQY